MLVVFRPDDLARDTLDAVKDLAELFLKIAAFCFIGAGAAVASVGLPLIEYAKEERHLRYQVEEATGALPSAEHCVATAAKGSRAKCKTALYMQSVLTESKAQLNRWIQTLSILGLLSFLVSVTTFGIAQVRRKRPEPG